MVDVLGSSLYQETDSPSWLDSSGIDVATQCIHHMN